MMEDLKVREENRATRFRMRGILIQELSVKMGPYVAMSTDFTLLENTKKTFPITLINFFQERKILLMKI